MLGVPGSGIGLGIPPTAQRLQIAVVHDLGAVADLEQRVQASGQGRQRQLHSQQPAGWTWNSLSHVQKATSSGKPAWKNHLYQRLDRFAIYLPISNPGRAGRV